MTVYQKPGFLTRRVGNPIIAGFTRLGLSMRGSHILEVRGRSSGKVRAMPVNPLSFQGSRYLVAPRGETHWARNLRASGGGVLRLGRKREAIAATEVPDTEKPPILRAYLERWGAETRAAFGVGKQFSDAELVAIAPRHPVFRISKS
jgi:deazaflavin-dependent oxidoreductase (nitroreductase family)